MIYVLRAGATYKIGSSSSPHRRHADIQRMSPVLLELIWKHPGDVELEMYLHRLFTEQRQHGEWFLFEEDPLPAIKAAVKEYLGKLEEPEELDNEDIWNL